MSLSLIENNKERFSKKIIANKKFKDINKPDVRIFYNQKEEFEYIAKKINQYQKAGIELKNTAEQRVEPIAGNTLRLTMDWNIQSFVTQVCLVLSFA